MKKIFRLTSDPDFNNFIFGQTFSQIGENMSKVSLVWLVMAVSKNSSEVLSVFITMQALPPLIFGWLYGHIIDNISSKRLLLFMSDIARGIVFCLIPLLYFLQLLTTPTLLLLAFIAAIFSGIFGPTMFSAIPGFSEKAGPLVQRNSLINITGHLGILIGPIMGGILSYFFNSAFVVTFTGVTFLVSSVFIGFIIKSEFTESLPKLTRLNGFIREIFKSTVSIQKPVEVLKANTLFAWNWSSTTKLFCVMSLLVGVSLGVSLAALPLYIKTELPNGPLALGIILTAGGLGMLTMSYLLGKSKSEFGRLKEEAISVQEIWLTGALFISGCVLIPMGLLHTVIFLSCITFISSGLADIYHPIMNTEVQTSVPEIFTGRVLTSIGSFFLVGIIGGSLLASYENSSAGLFVTLATAGIARILASFIPLIIRTKREYAGNNRITEDTYKKRPI